MHKEVPCKFCPNQAQYSPIEEMESMEVKVYLCAACKAEYLYFKGSDIANSTSLYTVINEKLYRWTVNALGDAVLWYVKNPGIPGTRANRDLEKLIFIPQREPQPIMTPANIEQKLRVYLVFL